MYEITRITTRSGGLRTDAEARQYTGCRANAKMEEGCVLLHCLRDNTGQPCDRYIRTSLVQTWNKDSRTGDVMVETMNSIYYLKYLKHD